MDQRSGMRSQDKHDPTTIDKKQTNLSDSELKETTTTELLRDCRSQGLNLGSESMNTEEYYPFNYSNFNATLVAFILERVFKKPFQTIMQEKLFTPLGMTETRYSTHPENKRASSHIWTNTHDLTKLFQHIREHPNFINSYDTKELTDQNQGYRSFAKIKRSCNTFSVGHDGGRDDFGSVAHRDSQGRVIIWLENAPVSDVDGATQLASKLIDMDPFHGDPTRIDL